MSPFRPARFRNGRTAWRRASRPDSGRPARRRSTAFRDGWDSLAAAGLTETRCASERGLAMGGGRPAKRRFTVGGSGKSVARCHRTVLAYWKFESISLQQRVCKLSVPEQRTDIRATVGFAERYEALSRQRTSGRRVRIGVLQHREFGGVLPGLAGTHCVEIGADPGK